MKLPILISYLLLGLLALLSIIQGNLEFLIYAAILIPFIILVHWSDGIFTYKVFALWGLALWLLLHILGGLTSILGTRTYDFIILNIIGDPYNILKYDQILHFYCYVVMALLIGSVVASVIKKGANKITIAVIIVLVATGVGAVNEIIEFLPVVLFNSSGPGGYINTALDLVMNFLGSILGAWIFLRKQS